MVLDVFFLDREADIFSQSFGNFQPGKYVFWNNPTPTQVSTAVAAATASNIFGYKYICQ